MKHKASFSTGLSSAVMVERMREKYGDKNIIIVFMDVKNEDADNYRFRNELILKRWSDIEYVELAEGRNPWQVAEDENMIFNQRRHPCTRILKIEPFMRWLENNADGGSVCIGIDWHEVDRTAAIKRNYNKAGYSVEFPLLWKPLLTKKHTDIARHEWRIEPPEMYEKGFSHANCGERGCFAWGIGDWIRFYINSPDQYLKNEAWEQMMRERVGDYAICRDQSNGEVKPRTLKSIRLEYENTSQLSLFDQRSHCTQCGIGDFVEVKNATS